MKNILVRCHEILWTTRANDLVGQIFARALVCLIVLNVLAVVFESMEEVAHPFKGALYGFEVFSVVVFSVEYALRVWSCTVEPNYARPILGRIRFMLSPLALVDLIAILPFYLPLAYTVDLRIMRSLRLVRLLRMLKLARYSESLRLLGRVLKRAKDEIAVTVFVIGLLVLVCSSIMYFAEKDAQPDRFSSIPAAMWWAVVTLTTVGYGDVYPVTTIGKMLAALLAFLGIGMFALPTGIISSGFMEEVRLSRDKQSREQQVCPHCGKEIPELPDQD